MRILVTGATGRLGKAVVFEAVKRGYEVTGVGSKEMDLTDPEQVRSVFEETKPEAVVHCAAWTDVESAELPQNRERVRRVNLDGTKHLIEAAQRLDAKFLFISTDFVFSGDGEQPNGVDTPRESALNFYGETKRLAELEVSSRLQRYFIVRIASLFADDGKSFVTAMLEAAERKLKLRVVCDSFSRPTYAPDAAKVIVDMVESDKYGAYNLTNEGRYVTKYDFARSIIAASGLETEITPVPTEEYGRDIARRPKNSRLDTRKIREQGFTTMPDWEASLKLYIDKKKETRN